MRAKMRNVKTGNVLDFTFKAAEMVDVLNIDKREMQYLYHDSNEVAFMDPRTYEQATVPAALISDQLGYLIADMICWVSWYGDEALGVILPVQVKLKVVEAEMATGGNTVVAAKKAVKLETGIEVMVPLFVKEGDFILVDTATGEYVSRTN
jgi:elongation factor P